jgi:hypothetical protein
MSSESVITRLNPPFRAGREDNQTIAQFFLAMRDEEGKQQPRNVRRGGRMGLQANDAGMISVCSTDALAKRIAA